MLPRQGNNGEPRIEDRGKVKFSGNMKEAAGKPLHV
ncbi:Uncharacterised protein [Burkholderia pseudomallei]|nr:Uncharacterised protein [Burkholderia pseudomallei]CAJ3520095.1 Uncharacterised protein [Burkholderia pseudomallei]CAJ4074536.1 Uncharacterised protein [Burkholderia pseudomallei]CAJ4396848.1 Uncharacterised protein [Burkholderia pseudomallei]CAJ4590657.1 Uncharacterised protein [Burkholderia pseudomallei]